MSEKTVSLTPRRRVMPTGWSQVDAMNLEDLFVSPEGKMLAFKRELMQA